MKYIARNNYVINWPEYPLLRFTICFIFGICLNDIYSIPASLLISISVFLVGVAMVLNTHNSPSKAIARLISTLILCIGFAFGMLCVNIKAVSVQSNIVSTSTTKDFSIIGRLSTPLKESKRLSTVLEIMNDGPQLRGKKVKVYFPSDERNLSYKKGDIISLTGKVFPLQDNSNPKAFNYKNYLKYRGIQSQIFLKEGNHQLLIKKESSIFTLTDEIRNWALSIFEKRLREKDHLAVASAMVLGYREHLSDDLYQSFSDTGAVHVLAVSGLHVGIICMLFISLFRRFKNESTFFKALQFFCLVFVTWMYALITGASPAVIRAAVMFTFLLMGRLWFKGANIYNVLAFSAFCILVYDPYILYHLSFQFSYLALLSILFFQPLIERLWDTRHWFVSRVWQLASVSIAAQVLIFPISIYYFHTFPIYFLLSGIAAVFLATFILVGGLLLLSFDQFPFVGDWFAEIYSWLIGLFVRIISSIQSLPFNKIEGLYFSRKSMIVLYLIIGIIMFLISVKPSGFKGVLYKKIKRRRVARSILMAGIVFLALNNLLFTKSVKDNQEMIVYDISKGSVIDLFLGDNVFSKYSDNLTQDKIDFSCAPYRIFKGAQDKHPLDSRLLLDESPIHVISNSEVVFKGQFVFFMDEINDTDTIPCVSDILMVLNNSTQLPYDILDVHYTSKVVLDNSLSYAVRNKWLKECKKRGVPVHDVRKDGVFIL